VNIVTPEKESSKDNRKNAFLDLQNRRKSLESKSSQSKKKMAARVSSDSTPVKKIATQSTFNECIVNNIPKFSKNSATKPITKPSKKSSNRPSSKRTPPAPIAQPAASPPPRKSIRESKTLPTSPPPRSSHPFGQIIAELDKLNSKVDRMQATLDRTPSVDFSGILHEFQNTFSSKCQEAYQELMQKYQLGD